MRTGSCSAFDPACQTQGTCSPLASQNAFVIQVIVKKFLSCHSIICSFGFSVYWGLTDHSIIAMTKSDRSVDSFRFSVQITLVFSVMVLALETWHCPHCGHCRKVSEVSQVKNSDRSLQFHDRIGNGGLMSIQLSSPWVVFCLSNRCQCRVCTGFGGTEGCQS